MPVRKEDAHRALELLESYCTNLRSPSDKQLRIAIERLINIFKSNLFQALLDIQEFYELILLDDSKDINTKALAALRISDKWSENPPIPNNTLINIYNNNNGNETINNNGSNGTMNNKKSPSYHSQISDQHSPSSPQQQQQPQSIQQEKLPNYDNHWIYEEIILQRPLNGGSLGFSIAGGSDNPIYGNNTSIFVTKLTPNGIAENDGRMRVNDVLYKVNDTLCVDIDHTIVVRALKESDIVRLTLKRLDPPVVEDILLKKTTNGLGFSISGGLFTEHINNDHGIFVTKIIKGGSADLNGRLSVNDRIICVNNVSLEYVTHDDAVSIISSAIEQSNEILLRVAKVTDYYTTTTATTSSAIAGSPLLDQQYQQLTSANDASNNDLANKEPRRVHLIKGPTGLGFNIVGGEGGEGIFISFILTGGPADLSGNLRKGDQIISVNDIDLVQATHEQAADILKNAGKQVAIVVQHRPEAYEHFQAKINERREQMLNSASSLHNAMSSLNQTSNTHSTTNLVGGGSSGTIITKHKKSLYVRALFDYDPSKDSGLPGKGLQFHYGDILHVINASDDEWWQAKRVNIDGQEEDLGIIPSKKRVERKERARLRKVDFRHNTEAAGKSNTLDNKKKKGGLKFFLKGNKKDSQSGDELSDHESNNDKVIYSYEPVIQQKLDYTRPVIILGPTKDRVNNDLIFDYPDKFGCCVPHTTRAKRPEEVQGRDYYFVESREKMERDIHDHLFIEAGQFGGNLYGTSIQSVREIADKGKHCILDVSGNAIKRLKMAQLYPIAIFIKPKSVDWIMETNKRLSVDEAKDQYEKAEKLEETFAEHFTAVVQGDSYDDVYNQCKEVISDQAGPIIWVPQKEPL